MSDIRRRALTALALNRTPGFHFPGNFLGVIFAENTAARSRVRLPRGDFCAEPDGQVHPGAIALLADIALASVVRANLNPAQRLATVSLQLQFTGAPLTGALEASGEFAGFLHGAAGQQGLSRCKLIANGQTALLASGAFMVLNPPPGVTMHPPVSADHEHATPLQEPELSPVERSILARIDATLASPLQARSFLQRFWGIDPQPREDGALCVVDNDLHLGNRVGHMQGGLQVGIAINTAHAALPADWKISGITACFISPGEGRVLRATSRVIHRGGQTAVVRTVITGKQRRRVLDATSTHVRRGGE
jgi:acyl-coenzyme A thioesterase PaaI-like protein